MTTYQILFCIYSTVLFTHAAYGFSYRQVKAFFGATPYEQVVEKDYTLNPHGRILLKNMQGNVSVKTGLDKRSIAVRATKHASAQEHLEHMHVIEEEVFPDRVILRTTYDYEKVKGSVDYVLTVPDDAHVEISNNNGDVTIQDVHGSLLTNVGTGNVTIYNPHQKTEVNILQEGNSIVIRPTDSVKLSTHKGTIRVVDSNQSVEAYAENGKIEVKCRQLPENNHIMLETHKGPITLHTPKSLECKICAETQNGTVTGNQQVTLDPLTVTLDESYWTKVKRSIKGCIGNKNAEVTLNSKNGNIIILTY